MIFLGAERQKKLSFNKLECLWERFWAWFQELDSMDKKYGILYANFKVSHKVSLFAYLADIYMNSFENTLYVKISFPFSTCSIDDTFTFIDTPLYKLENISQIVNYIDNKIQFAYEIMNNDTFPFLYTLVSFTDIDFTTLV